MPTPPLTIDPGLKKFAEGRQGDLIDAIISEGSLTSAAAKLGMDTSNASKSIKRLQERAAKQGYAPGHWTDGVAPGYAMGKVTVQRGPGGTVERTWERQSPEAEARDALLKTAAEALAESMPRLPAMASPTSTLAKLANLYVITDYHVGMMAWSKEGGADWDLKIAERTLIGAMEYLVGAAPPARVGILAQLGDFLHMDGLMPVTPTSGHILDADGRYSKVVQVAVRCLRRVVDLMLMKHAEVHVLMCEGNHDLASSVWLRTLFAALYENDPRVTINDSELPFYAYRHGRTMLAFHHGHTKKKEGLPLLFAAQFPEMWGATSYRVVHTGHQHHEDLKEHAGMRVHQHPTLAARDAHASRHGWFAERMAPCLTYHEDHGKVGEIIVTPAMLGDCDLAA